MTNLHARTRIGVLTLATTIACMPSPDITVTPLGAERSYPATPDSVAIPLYTVTKPECPYEELAALTAEGGRSDEALLAALRQRARAVGGQAIIGYTQGVRASNIGSHDVSVRTGTAIRFRSSDCTR